MPVEKDLERYRDSVQRQHLDWIRGESKHNILYNECCPDFSCCMPMLFEQNRLRRIESYNQWASRYGRPQYRDDS